MLLHTEENLNFNQIRKNISKFALSDIGKENCLNIRYNNDIETVNNELDIIDEMIFLCDNCQLPSIYIVDIKNHLKKAKVKNSILDPKEIIEIAYCMRTFRNLKLFFHENTYEFNKIKKIVDNIKMFKEIEQNIIQSISDDYEIYDNASKELKSIRNEIKIIQERIEKKLKKFLYNPNNKRFIQDTIIVKRQNRFVIPLKADHKGQIKGIILDSSSSGETLFIEIESVIEDNNKLNILLNEEREEIIRILKKLTIHITNNNEEILYSLKEFAIFDTYFAKARYCKNNNTKRPEINNDGIFDIKNAKHPLLKGEVVPIDIIIGENYRILIITGPNTGGKTVSLKTLGILTLMTMAGLYIPANEGSKVSIVDNVFVDIGDEQSIEQNLSTFSGHIKRIIKIIKAATEKSLILIDELGAGTDPKEGSALGIAIINYILKINANAFITTHFSDIKNAALTNNSIESASCEFNEKTLMATYKLIYGITGKSNAILIAEKLGLKKELIENAKNIISLNKDGDDKLYETLAFQKEKYLKLIKKYELKDKILRDKIKIINEKEEEINKKEIEINNLIRNEKKNILRSYKKELQNIIDSYNENIKIKDNEIKNKIKNDINKIEKDIIIIKKEDDKQRQIIIKSKKLLIEELEINDIVRVKGLDKKGKITEINKKKNEITVQIGDIKFTTSISEIERVDDEIKKIISEVISNKEKIVTDTSNYTTEIDDSISYEINIIGKRGDEALRITEDYIDKLYMNGREFARIVHGKGKGILRTLIENLLKQHPKVESYKFAPVEQGGYGVTEIKIKKE